MFNNNKGRGGRGRQIESFIFRLNSSFTQSMTIPPPLLLSRANLLQSKMDLYFSFDQDDAADYDER